LSTSPRTLFVSPNIGSAQVVRATLDAAGIACDIPDEHVASLGWHLGNVISGVRVRVDEADLERAKELLAALESQALADASDSPEEALSAEADRKATRAWRLAILGFAMWPFFHPYALVVGLRALKAPALSVEGRQRARTAVGTSIAALVAFAGAIAAVWAAFA
jgi:putative signal transducing protein